MANLRDSAPLKITVFCFVGGKEVEVIGTPERLSEPASPKGKPDLRVSCRSLGEADHEGWLSKKGTTTCGGKVAMLLPLFL